MNPKIVPLETEKDWEVFEKVLQPLGFKLQHTAITNTRERGWIPSDDWDWRELMKRGNFYWRAIYV